MCVAPTLGMTTDDGTGEGADPLAPDDAFAVLGDETRVAILRVLGEADGPLGFSDLRERVGMRDSGGFNYHLDRLVGHFVERDDDGYRLRRAGERVIEAVLSGAVTASPVREPTRVDWTCHYCGAPVGVSYREERLRVFCTECPGVYGRGSGPDDYGLHGTLYLPPAGVEGRDATQLLRAASVWGGLATMAAVGGVCPRCSAALSESVEVCEDHERAGGGDGTDGACCDACGGRYAAGIRFSCTNCIYERSGAFGVRLLANADLRSFLTARGVDPVTHASHSTVGAAMDYDEEVVSTDPFEARFTFRADGDALTLTVGDDRSVTDVSRGGTADG